MQDKDFLWRGTALNGQFRLLAVEATQAVQTARDLHDLSPVSTLLLGKMLCATAMLSLDLKKQDSEITLRLEGNGELKGALAICNFEGDLRGYAFVPQLFLATPADNFYPVKALGDGTLSVIRSIPNQRPTSGYTKLTEGEVAQNLAHYFEQSEQIPSAVNLGVLIDQNAHVLAAGGFIIQQLPNASQSEAEHLIEKLSQTPNVSDLMDMGLNIRDIMRRFIFTDGDFELEQVHTVQYQCTCSRERFSRALLLLGIDELEDMREGIEPVCHFCNQTYHFSPEDMSDLITSLKEPQ
jgi:molecular chaperone Hsp33